MIILAEISDADKVNEIYEKIHAAEDAGKMCVGWARNVYPIKQTAVTAIEKKQRIIIVKF